MFSFGKKIPEVLVVGAGPVGLSSALFLAKNGINKIQIVDNECHHSGRSYALALHSSTLKIFDEFGLLNDILDQSYQVRTIAIYDNNSRRGEMYVSELDEDFSFIAVLPQRLLEEILEKTLKELGIKISWNHRLAQLRSNADSVAVTVDKIGSDCMGYAISHYEKIVENTDDMDVKFVIGADGHSSLVRRATGISFEKVCKTQHFAVFEFKTDANLNNEMSLVLDDATTNVLWPLPDGYCRWSFQLLNYDAPEDSREKDWLQIRMGQEKYPVLSEKHLHELKEHRGLRVALIISAGVWLYGLKVALPVRLATRECGLPETRHI